MEMSEKSKKEYTEKMRERYARMRGKQARSVLLDEFTAVTGWERKYANKVLLGRRRKSGRRGKRGAPRRYGGELIGPLKKCWLAMEQPCGKRMKDMLPLWAGHLECGERIRKQLTEVSAATIDRLLKDYKVSAGKKVRPPKPASAVKALVKVRAQSWDNPEPGFTEVDTVAHCGGDMGGDFFWTLTSVDVSSGWSEVRAIWNRGQHVCLQGLETIWAAQPFELKGVDSDNGGEFLNHHLYRRLKERGIEQTRSRPYYKNDQAYVEQKNYTHVRQLLGYERLEHREMEGLLNALLERWSMWKNLFCVTMKQESKERIGCKQIRRHSKQSRTPAQRLIESGHLGKEAERELREELRAHNPFKMRAEIRALEDAVWKRNKELCRLKAGGELAFDDASPLRSEPPSKARKTTKKPIGKPAKKPRR